MSHADNAYDAPATATPETRSAQPVCLPPLGYKRCTACGERRRIKGGCQKGGRFVCATCRLAATTRTPP